jgi:CRP/FNR family cyclic AMP-dependent transcriptional regulator
MISTTLLHRSQFFKIFTEDQLKAIAMIADVVDFPKGALVVRENTSARKLFLLLDGDVDLIYSGGGEGAIVNALVGSIAPGEVFGVSSLIEPFEFISSVRTSTPSRVISIDALALRAMSEIDPKLGLTLMRQVSAAVLERLKFTQVELAAARA